MAPATDPIVQIRANLNDLDMEPIAIAMSRISGGIGKKTDSINASTKSAIAP